MAAIEFDSDVLESFALYKFASSLGVSRAAALGHLTRFWMWIAKEEPDDLHGVPADFLAHICDYKGSGSIYQALLDAAFIVYNEHGVVTVDGEYWRKTK